MKKLLLGLWLLTVACFSTELILNGDFEQGLDNWEVATWIPNNKVPELEKTDMPGAGTASIKMQCTPEFKTVLWQPITLPKGEDRFVFSVSMKSRNVTKGYCICYIALNDVKPDPASVNTPACWKDGPNSEWTTYHREFQAPEDPTKRKGKVYITTTTDAQGLFLVDNVSLKALDAKAEAKQLEEVKKTNIAKMDPALAVPSGFNLMSSEYVILDWYGPATTPKTGKESLDFSVKKGEFAAVMQPIRITDMDGQRHRFSAWVKAPDDARNSWSVSVLHKDSPQVKSIQYNARPTGKTDTDGYVEVACEPMGLEKDTKEMRAIFRLFNPAPRDLEISIRKIRLETLLYPTRELTVEKIQLHGVDHDSLYAAGETPKATILLKSTFPEKQRFMLKFVIRDYWGKEVTEMTCPLELPGMTVTPFEMTFPQLVGHPGFYEVTLQRQADLNLAEQEFSILVVDEVPAERDPVFGFTFFTDTVAKAEGMRLLGVGTKGILFEWILGEPAPGQYEWKNYDAAVAAAKKAGLKICGGFSMGSKAVARHYRDPINKIFTQENPPNPYTAAFYNDSDKFVRAVVNRYKEDIHHWALCAEINLLKDSRPYELTQYLERSRRTALIVKEISPDATIVGIGCSGADGRAIPRYPVMRELWKNKGLHKVLDGVGLDQYTSPQAYGPGFKPVNSEDGMLREMLQEALRIVKEDGKSIVAVDEKGYTIKRSLPIGSSYARDMANVLSREYVIIKSLEVQHWLYYKWTSFTHKEVQDWGMFAPNGPRPSAAAYAGTARLMANATFVEKPELHRAIQGYVFTMPDKRTLLVLWHSGEDSATMLADFPGDMECRDVQGNQFPHAGREFVLTAAPVFCYTKDSPQQVLAMLKEADISLPEIEGEFNVGQDGQVQLLLKNLTPNPLEVTAEFLNEKTKLKLAPNAVQTLISKHALAMVAKGELKGVASTTKGRKYSIQNTLTTHGIAPVANGMNEVLSLPPIAVLNHAELHLNNIDYHANRLWTGPDDCSLELRMGYDADNLYISYQVTDDIHCNESAVHRLWAEDCVQFAFDPNCDAKVKALQGKTGLFDDDSLFSFGLSHEGAGLFCHLSPDKGLLHTSMQGMQATRDEAKKQTSYQVTLPWKNLGIEAVKGRIFAYNVIVMDADAKGQGAIYWMQLTPGIAGGQNPEKYHYFQLQ